MSRRDGTGPMSEGALTGRGLGNCESAENGTQNTANQAVVKPARGLGRGRNCMGGQRGNQGQGQGQGRGCGCGRSKGRKLGRNMDNQ